MKVGNLFLYTQNFPYGKNEPFVLEELNYLAKRFSKIYIIPNEYLNEMQCEIPKNVTVCDWRVYDHKYVSYKSWITVVKLIDRRQIVSSGLTNLKYEVSRLKRLDRRIHAIDILISELGCGIHYSYWFDEWATVLAVLKSRKKISKFISRAHGFDLYNERAKNGLIQQRNFQLNQVDQVFTVSTHGQHYLKSKNPEYRNKIKLARLGTKALNPNPFLKGEYHLVSCSRLVALKRVHLIVELLNQMSLKVSWTHFGEGPELEKVKENALRLPANITTYFPGFVSNREIMKQYESKPIHLFLNMSESEGLPVSLMEAASAGIPLLATDVGGNSEIVNDLTGILIPMNFDTNKVAKTIESFLESDRNGKIFRSQVRSFWNENFNASNNFEKFSDTLMNFKV